MDKKELFTLRQVSQQLNIPSRILRRFCDKGLIRGVRRSRKGYRVLNGDQIELAHIIYELQKCGMGWDELKNYLRLERQGDITIPERRAILQTKRRQLRIRMNELQNSIDFTERQEDIFDEYLVEPRND